MLFGCWPRPIERTLSEPVFKSIIHNLHSVKNGLFIYHDDVVRAMLEAVYWKLRCRGGTSVVFTYAHDDTQYILGHFGTLALNDECSTCDSVCRHNPQVESVLSISDLLKDARTRSSVLVRESPKLRAYVGIRLSFEVSLVVLSSSPMRRRQVREARYAIELVAPITQAMLKEDSAIEDHHDQVKFVADAADTVVRATRASLDYFGCDIILMSTSDLVPGGMPPDGGIAVCLNGKKAVFDVETKKRGIKVVYVKDATVTAKLQNKTAELEVQRKIVSQLAHELRNKFTVSVGVLEHVSELPLDDDMRKDVKSATALLREADRVITTRLDIYRFYKKGGYCSETEVVDAIRDLLPRFGEGSSVPVLVSDKTHLANVEWGLELDVYVASHVLTNLVTNSIKYTKQGKIELSVHDARQGSVTFGVYDTGSGLTIDPDTLFKSEGILSADERGTGLGLASCALFLHAVRGDIWIESAAAGQYTDVRFTMPCRLLTGLPQAIVCDHTVGTLDVNEVHIVEDSPFIRRVIQKKLTGALDNEPKFVEYDTVEDAIASMRLMQGGAPSIRSIVTVDHNLHGKGGQLTGSNMIAYLTSTQYQGIIVSASGDDTIGREHIDLGAHIAAGKPFPSSTALRDLLRSATRRRTLSRSTRSSLGEESWTGYRSTASRSSLFDETSARSYRRLPTRGTADENPCSTPASASSTVGIDRTSVPPLCSPSDDDDADDANIVVKVTGDLPQ